MRLIIMLFMLSIYFMFFLGLFLFIKSKFRKVKKNIDKTIKSSIRSKEAFDSFMIANSYHSIDLNDSLSITQYGNELLKEFGKLSDLMVSLSQNSFIEEANLTIKEIVSHKNKEIDEQTNNKFNFISNFTKSKLLEQTVNIQKNIPNLENKLNEFDSAIENAKKAFLNIKTSNSKKSSDIHNDMTLKSNGELLQIKISSLTKSKLYYEQSIIQLKTILSINNNVIINFDEIIYNVLPLIKNQKSLDSIKSINFENFNKMIKDFDKLKEIRVMN